jgi:hypothetical protein
VIAGFVATLARKSISGLTEENPLKRVPDARSKKQALQNNPLEWVLVCEPWN